MIQEIQGISRPYKIEGIVLDDSFFINKGARSLPTALLNCCLFYCTIVFKSRQKYESGTISRKMTMRHHEFVVANCVITFQRDSKGNNRVFSIWQTTEQHRNVSRTRVTVFTFVYF